MSRYRTAQRVVEAPAVMEGAGVLVHRAFPNHEVRELDPFLLLDHMGPAEMKPGEAQGFPDHPHRGFETVTYMLHGEMQHRDSFGHAGTIGPGDVQWMTAGSGLVHAEMPGASLVKNGGRMEGFQLWVNLPAKDKMKAPRYQELGASHIPVVKNEAGDVEVKVIAGEALGVRGAVETQIPIQYLHFRLNAGAAVVHQVAASLSAMVYVIHGAVKIGATTVGQFHLASLARDADEVELAAETETEFLLIAAQPIGEPVARYGPFVMNTRDELEQAFADYRAGKMGTIEHADAR